MATISCDSERQDEILEAEKDDESARPAHEKTPEKQGFSCVKSGEGGIRTLGDAERHTGFRDRHLQPLGHLSGC